MNISRYMKEHEASVKLQLHTTDETVDWRTLAGKHRRIITEMQHERLVHLLVTLSFGLFMLITVFMTVMRPILPLILLATLFFIMLIPYIAHYFFIENSIQRWYLLMDELEKKEEGQHGAAM